MRMRQDKIPVQKERWSLSVLFRGERLPVEGDEFFQELEDSLGMINKANEGTADAVNANEGSAIVVPGAGIPDLPSPERALQGKIFQVTVAGAQDLGYVCVKNAANAYIWVNIY